MKKKLRVVLALVAALVMVMGASLTAFAADGNTFNGNPMSIEDWTEAGTGVEWELKDGVFSAKGTSQFVFLRFNQNLGENYTIDFDYKQETEAPGSFKNQFIGFGIKEGDSNLTVSGYSLNLVAGFARVMRFEDYNNLFGNHYDGDINMAALENWTHFQIKCENGNKYTITFNDGADRKIEFTDDTFRGGFFQISAYGNMPSYYKNIQIVNTQDVPPTGDPNTPMLWCAMIVLAAAGMAMVALRMRSAK